MRFYSALMIPFVLAALTPGGGPAPVERDTPAPSPRALAETDAPSTTISYQVGSLGEVGRALQGFRASVAQTLDDPRGWSQGGSVRFVTGRPNPTLRIWLASPDQVAAAHSTCDALFSCRVGPDVYINITRWRNGATGTWNAPLAEYRRYVVNHEVGHWLGLDHRDCPGYGQPAPVMMQQTIRLDGCQPRTWPLPHELRAAEELLD